MDVLNQVMGVQEASELWGLSADRVKGLCQANKVKCKKIGKSWVLLKEQPNPKKQRLQGGNVPLNYTDRETEEIYLDGARNILSKVYPEFNNSRLWLMDRGHFYSVMYGHGLEVAQITVATNDKYAENRKLVIKREGKKDVQVVAKAKDYIVRDIKEIITDRLVFNKPEATDWLHNRLSFPLNFLDGLLHDQKSQAVYKWRDIRFIVKFERVDDSNNVDDDMVIVKNVEVAEVY